jgi:hypothetical protein
MENLLQMVASHQPRGGMHMGVHDAKAYVGSLCEITWKDRVGNTHVTLATVEDARYVPLYGAYLITDAEDIRLDQVVSIEVADVAMRKAA